MSCFSPQADTKQPQVRLSDQYQYSAGSTGCPKHWTGSSVCVFPLDMTSVQLAAGKTTQSHSTNTHKGWKRWMCTEWDACQLPINFWLQLTLADFYCLLPGDIIQTGGENYRQGRAEDHRALRVICQLFSPLISMWTHSANPWVHSILTSSHYTELFLEKPISFPSKRSKCQERWSDFKAHWK